MAGLTAIFKARDKVSSTMEKMNKSTEGLTKTFGKLRKIASRTLTGMSVAIGGIAIKGIKDFAGFDKSMREVWTLLPNMSKKAFGLLQEQVLSASKNLKLLPEEVVPALYQSLSLGVPQGGVFGFLKVANKLAVGGVTELSTAVTSLRSIVKGLGLDISDTSKVSDILFTTMKLGATTIPELADQFPKVTAFAGNLGIKIEELGASFAALTGVTGNTAEVSTQMRGLFAEMSRSNTKLSQTFKNLTGKSFKDFIRGGGNLMGALRKVRKATDAAGIDFVDLFGSVEAGTAALALTGTQFNKYNDSLDAMRKGAGATNNAFEKMNDGLFVMFKRLRSQAKASFIQLGSALSGPIEEAGNKFIEQIPKMEEFFKTILEKAPGAMSKLIEGFTNAYEKVSAFFNYISENKETLKNIAVGIAAVAGAMFVANAAITLVNGAMAIFMIATSPISAIILAIVAAVYVLYKLITTGALVKGFKATFGVLKLFFDSILFTIKSVINGIISIANKIPGINIPKFENEVPKLGVAESPKVIEPARSGLNIEKNAQENGMTNKDILGSTVNNTNNKSVNNNFEIKIDGIGQVTSKNKEQAKEDFEKMLERVMSESIDEDTYSLDY